MTNNNSPIQGKYSEMWDREYSQYLLQRGKKEKWPHLERLHILSQLHINKHYLVHFLMLREALIDRNIKEFIGQIFRFVLILPGHILQRLPRGNIGTVRVSAFQESDIPQEFQDLFR